MWRGESLQITAYATNEYMFELHVPELSEATDALLGDATTRHYLSAKGKPGMAFLDRYDIARLADQGVFAAIRELTTPRAKELLRELQKLRADGAVDEGLAEIAAHWGGRSGRRYKSAEELQKVPRADAPRALETLCAAGWAERGLKAICATCGLSSFVALPDTSAHASCPGCSSSATYETGASLTVYYRLSSYVDLLSDQGVLPHLLTIAALRRRAERTHFLPGVDVWFDADGRDQAEADLFGIRDGQVLSGEVKPSASEFSPDQIKRDVALSVRLRADTHVLAATDDIPQNVTDRAKQECEAVGLSLIVLTRADLIP